MGGGGKCIGECYTLTSITYEKGPNSMTGKGLQGLQEASLNFERVMRVMSLA